MNLIEKIKALKNFEAIQAQYNELDNKIKDLSGDIAVLEEKQKQAGKEYDTIHRAVNTVKQELGEYEGCVQMEELGIPYKPIYQNLDKITYEINRVQRDIGTLLSTNSVFVCQKSYTVNNSKSKGEQFQKNYCNNLLIGFNAYFEKKKKSVTENNYTESCRLIENNFNKACKRGETMGFTLNDKYLKLCLDMLKLELEQKIAKTKEKARIKEERKRLKEQEQLIEEARKEKEKLLAQRKAEDIAYAKALTDEERETIKANIQALDKRINDIDYRVNNPKAGWVYIIHSESLPGMVKIGVSRRLNGPYERISELSSSSLPMPFLLDGFCFSDDAFATESGMHDYFDKQRVAPNREFFYTDAKTAIDVLNNKFHKHIILSDIKSEDFM